MQMGLLQHARYSMAQTPALSRPDVGLGGMLLQHKAFFVAITVIGSASSGH